MVSRAPAVSPASTMLTANSENTLLCRPMAPASVSPDSTADTMERITLRK